MMIRASVEENVTSQKSPWRVKIQLSLLATGLASKYEKGVKEVGDRNR